MGVHFERNEFRRSTQCCRVENTAELPVQTPQELAGQNMSLEDLRRQYTMGGITKANLPERPLALFAEWMQTALDQAPAEWIEPYAMTLATASTDGQVSARTVLLRGYDDQGFVFYTSYDSHKGSQLAENSNCSLVFYWGYLERQVRIRGVAGKIPTEQSNAYFQKRPRGSQIGATVSRQSQPLQNREELELAVQQFEAKIGDGAISLPPTWGGYCVSPTAVEFWQGRRNRLHDRIVYQREGLEADWQIVRLSP